MRKLLLLTLLSLPACQCEMHIEPEPANGATVAETPIADAGLSEDERKIQAIMSKFTYEEIDQMWLDISSKDNRPETKNNDRLLFEARKRLRIKPADLSKSEAVNQKLRGL